jgi:hypothetical protein
VRDTKFSVRDTEYSVRDTEFSVRDTEFFTVALMKIFVVCIIEVVSIDVWLPTFRKIYSSPYSELVTIYHSTRCYIPEDVNFFTCVPHRFPDKKGLSLDCVPSQFPMSYC